jgi:hypothetical protein
VNGRYKGVNYHHENSSGNNKGGKSPAPKDGQAALDKSIQIKDTSPRRIGISEGEFVILDRTSEGIFHGHVRTWEEIISDPDFDSIINKMQKAGIINKKGNILK